MKTLISVDFDYFCPEDPDWDLGHQENGLHLSMIWKTRGFLESKMRCDGRQVGFWDRIGVAGFPKVYVSESHLSAYHVALETKADHIVMFDAYHDCWPVGAGACYPQCHNWLKLWLRGSRRRTARWCRPDHSAFGMPRAARLDLSGSQEVRVDRNDVVGIHVCRSGCWVPPWLDKEFIGFVESLGSGKIENNNLSFVWDAMQERWNESDFQDMRATYLAEREFNKKLSEMPESMRARMIKIEVSR